MASEPTAQGRLIVIQAGARWPAWSVSYRSLRPVDAVIAQSEGEDGRSFAARVARAANELSNLGCEVGRVLLSVAPGLGEKEDLQALARAVGSAGPGCVLELTVSSTVSERDRRELTRLEEAAGRDRVRVQIAHPGTARPRQVGQDHRLRAV